MSKLKVCVVTPCEMGHFIPCLHIAEELASRGHEVHVVTVSYFREKCQRMITEAGCIPHFTKDGYSREGMDKVFKSDGGYMKLNDQFYEFFKEEVLLVEPDVALVDFLFPNLGTLMKELEIPCVINEPGMMTSEAYMEKYFQTEYFSVWFGLGIWKESLMSWISYKFFERMSKDMGRLVGFWKTQSKTVRLINSFWGLDKPMPLPPTYILTGPLVKGQGDLIQGLKAKNFELYEWLEKAYYEGKPVIYLSLGSVCSWVNWEVEALYHGLKELGARVVWSIKNPEYIPDQEDPDLLISPWVPQVEMLAHPAIKAGLSHCGFGGVLEFSSAGVPIAAFPHFADQGPNAKKVVDRKMGVSLISISKAYRPPSLNSTYESPLFDKEKVKAVFKELIDNPIYAENMRALQKQARKQGGRSLAARTVESVALHGSDHLILDENLTHYNTSCWGSTCLSFFFLIWIVALAMWSWEVFI